MRRLQFNIFGYTCLGFTKSTDYHKNMLYLVHTNPYRHLVYKEVQKSRRKCMKRCMNFEEEKMYIETERRGAERLDL